MRTPAALSGDGVRLRRWRPSDAPAVEAVLDDPIVGRWSGLPREGAASWIARQMRKPDGVSLAVTRSHDDNAIGKTALGHHDAVARRAELSYWLVPKSRGRGLAVTACRLLAAWGFEVAHLDVIVLDIELDNVASQGVARRLGAEMTDAPPRLEADRAGVSRRLALWELRPGQAVKPSG
jgi:RimJ/RimL family protein N-acetyltransferase